MTHLIVVAVGTDHHKFDRMITWIDGWIESSEVYIQNDVRVFVQRGTSIKPANCESEEILPHSELLQMFEEATAVVCHGGPSTVMDARACGKLPIVLSRDPRHKEHVDSHQQKFARHLHTHNVARVVNVRSEFEQALNEAILSPEAFLVPEQVDSLPGVVNFGGVMDSLLQTSTLLGGSDE